MALSTLTSATNRLTRLVRYMYYATQVNVACSRGSLDLATRKFDPRTPRSWEFSAFSQNGEDGVIDHLLSLVREPNRYFLEIGASNGLENNTAFLAYVKKYEGVMVEGDPRVSRKAKPFVMTMNPGVQYMNLLVTPGNVDVILSACRYTDPDLFSLDIDSHDFHVAQACLDAGLRPKVVCVEYNSAFGPDRPIAVPCTGDSGEGRARPSVFYYGASIMAWRALFEPRGYQFVSVESRGVNAFFIDPATVDEDPLKGVEAMEFAENLGQLERSRGGWKQQFESLATMPFHTVGLEQAASFDSGATSKGE